MPAYAHTRPKPGMGIEIIVSSFWCHCAAYVLEFIHIHRHTHTHTTDKADKCALRNNKMLVIVGYYYYKHTQQRWRWRWRRSRLWLHGACLHIFFARFVLPLTLTFTFECSNNKLWILTVYGGTTNWAKTGKHKRANTHARTHTHAESRAYIQ